MDWAVPGSVAFESPAWLQGLWALPAIVLFYLLRRRAHRVLVPFLPFWERVFADRKRKPTFVRTLLSILLHLLAAAAILVVLARPYREESFALPRPSVVVIDRTLGTRAKSAGGTLADETLARARQALARAAAEGPVSVAVLRARLEPLGRATDASQAAALLAEPPAPAGVRSLADVVTLRSVSDPGTRVVLVTPFLDGTEGLPGVTVLAGARDGIQNGGIRRVSHAAAEGALEVSLDAGGLARRLRLVDADGVELAGVAAPGDATQVVLNLPRECPREVVLELDPRDAFPDDDVAPLVLPERGKVRIALASDEATPALDSALLASGVMDQSKSGRVALARLPEVAAGFDVVVVVGARAETALPEGRYLLIGSQALGVPLVVKGGEGEARAVRKSPAVPWLASLDVDEWRIHRMPLLEAGEGLEVLVEGTRGPLVSRFRSAGARGLVLSVPAGLDASTLPLLPAFPLMLRGALLELAPREAASGPVVHRATGRIVLSSEEAAEVVAEGGAPRPLRLAKDGGGFELPDEAGVFRTGSRRFSTAWLDHPALPGAARTGDDAWPEPPSHPGRRSLQPAVLLFLLAVLVAEWCSYHFGATD